MSKHLSALNHLLSQRHYKARMVILSFSGSQNWGTKRIWSLSWGHKASQRWVGLDFIPEVLPQSWGPACLPSFWNVHSARAGQWHEFLPQTGFRWVPFKGFSYITSFKLHNIPAKWAEQRYLSLFNKIRNTKWWVPGHTINRWLSTLWVYGRLHFVAVHPTPLCSPPHWVWGHLSQEFLIAVLLNSKWNAFSEIWEIRGKGFITNNHPHLRVLGYFSGFLYRCCNSTRFAQGAIS